MDQLIDKRALKLYDVCTNVNRSSQMRTRMDPDRLEFLAQVAHWYYEAGLSQEDIAQRIDRSRSLVSRLLQEAREKGVVEIRVHYPLKRDTELETHLRRSFPHVQPWVLADPPADYETLLRRLGELGSRCLQEWIHDGVRVGVGWGTAVYEVVRAMPALELQNSMVIQIIGSVGSRDPVVDGPELARFLAQKLSATYRVLHAPLIVEDATVAQSLLKERTIAEILDQARHVDVALVGIGTVDPSLSSLERAGYLDENELEALSQAGVVGDVVARQLDAGGRLVNSSINQRVIGIDLESLRTIPAVIGVAGSIAKAPAMLAALRGNYIGVLVTDARTASQILTATPRLQRGQPT